MWSRVLCIECGHWPQNEVMTLHDPCNMQCDNHHGEQKLGTDGATKRYHFVNPLQLRSTSMNFYDQLWYSMAQEHVG
jgi:hypothetical protein